MNNTQSVTLAQKLLRVQRSIGAVTKSSNNPHFRSKYADLNEVLDVAKVTLNDEGIFISQSPGANEFGKYLETSLIDAETGQQIAGRVFFSGAEENMQKIGAAITYARRFGLVSLLALESEDDDGETAVGRGGGSRNGEGETKALNGGASKPKPPGNENAGKVPPVQAKVPAPTSRKTLNEKISLTSKVLVDSKRMTQEDAVKLVTNFGVKSKEELTDEQAAKLLKQYEDRLNAK